jgi:hypothetical protein
MWLQSKLSAGVRIREGGGIARRWGARSRCGIAGVCGLLLLAAGAARGDAFSAYALDRTFALPAGASSFDVLADGRIVTLVDDTVFTESASGSAIFNALGTLAGADVSPGAFATAFVRVSPDGSRIAVGNNGGVSFGNFQVGVFDLNGLNGGWYPADHFDAAWIDNQQLALTGGTFGQPARVIALDTVSPFATPTIQTLIEGIGGGSAGVAFDAQGNLYTGNGFDGAGTSDTGWVKAFDAGDWQAALSGGAAIDFEAEGTLIVDVLSAGALGFDAAGNLHVGGGDFSGSGEFGFAALVRAGEVQSALGGGGAVNAANPNAVRRLDPDTANGFNFYDVNFNAVTGELYVREGSTVYSYVVPEPGTLTLMAMLAGTVVARRRGTKRLRC